MGSFFSPPKPKLPPPAPLPVVNNDAEADELRRLEKIALRRRQGRAAQILTSGLGDTSRVAVRRPALRSEERRVGKECRSRWSPYH